MTTPLDPREELQQLQTALEARGSTLYFVRTAIAFVAALIGSGAAAKLFVDSVRFPVLGLLASVVSLSLAIFAVIQLLRGQRLLRRELADYERLKVLLNQLGLDNPASLLPSR